MSEQGGNWADGPDETERGADLGSQLGYLRAAAGWLDSAETARSTDAPEADRAMWGAARLAELNIAMARACADHRIYEYQRKVSLTAQADGRLLFGGTELEDTERAVREQIKAENADYVAAMEKRLGEQLKADDEEHQAVTLRPGVDPEPEAEGELWTDDGQRFVYAVASFRTPDDSEAPRWLLARHYAQVLRWQSAPEPKSSLETWEGLDGKIGWSDDAPLRRPTAEERAAFYGPEPDPQPAIEELHERTTTPPPATLGEAFRTPYGGAAVAPQVADLWAFTSREGTALAELSTDELRVLQDTIARHIPVREGRQQPPSDSGMFRDRG